jgi:hypothetical protein
MCDSIDCGVYFERRKLATEMSALGAVLHAASAMLEGE